MFRMYFLVCVHVQEELQEMKQRVRVVVVQNETLQSELQSKYVDESLNDYTIQNSTVRFMASVETKSNGSTSAVMSSSLTDVSLHLFCFFSQVNKSHGGQNLSLSMKGQSLQQKTGQTLRNELVRI